MSGDKTWDESLRLSRRDFERHRVNLMARYFIKGQSTHYQECTVLIVAVQVQPSG